MKNIFSICLILILFQAIQSFAEKEKAAPDETTTEENTIRKALKNINLYEKQDLKDKKYAALVDSLKDHYIPHVVLSNLAKDMGYTEGDKVAFLDAINSLEFNTREKLLAFYDNKKSNSYKRLISHILHTKEVRKDIPPSRIIEEAVEYRYSKLRASIREKILIRISKRKKQQPQVIKDLSRYSLDELIKEIESREWSIKLERHPAYIKKNKAPVL